MDLPAFLQSALAGGPRGQGAAGPDPRRAAPRIRIGPLHSTAFTWHAAGGQVNVPVANLSASGVALLRSALPGPPGPAMEGLLQLGDRREPVALEPVHTTHDVVGCAFRAPGAALVDAINAHLAAELRALEMVRAEEATLAHDGPGHAVWFHGGENSELYYVERGGRILRFRLSFLGNFLEGGEGRPVRFGVLTCDRDLARDRAGEVHWLRKINAEQLATTLRFVSSVPGLDPAHRDAILALVR